MATEMARRSRVLTEGEAYCLPPASHWLALVERRRAWRLAWRSGTAALLALGLSVEDLDGIEFETCANDIALVERLEDRFGDAGLPPMTPVPLDIALKGLDRVLAGLEAPARALSA